MGVLQAAESRRMLVVYLVFSQTCDQVEKYPYNQLVVGVT